MIRATRDYFLTACTSFIRRASLRGVVIGVSVSLAACATVFDRDVTEINGPTRLDGNARTPLRFLWRTSLVPEFSGSYEPIETASVAFDLEHDRVYVGSSAGSVWAFSSAGQRLWRTSLRAAIDGQPAVDAGRGELYVGTSEGTLVALDARTGALRWQKPTGAPVRNQPVLAGDAVYVVTTNDAVVAMARADGETLWRYRRDEQPEGFSLAGHAGLVLVGNKLVTGFTDGSVVAIDAADGRVAWERNTTDDLDEATVESATRFKDVDTTPVVDGDSVFVASFAAGLYELALSNGSVRARDANRTGIAAIALADNKLILSSSDEGLVCINRTSREVLWKRAVQRGAATGVVVVGRSAGHRQVLVGENMGAFLAVSLESGAELSRWESGHGFAARPTTDRQLAFVVSNGGSLFAFAVQ